MIVGGGPLFTFGEKNSFFHRGGLRIEKGIVQEVDSWENLRARYPQEEYYDTQGKIILPGMTCAHHHLYSTFARGIDLKGKSPQKFGEILQDVWWRLDKCLTLEDVYYSALVPLLECIKYGTTSIIDHHASPRAVKGSLQTIAQAVKEAGIRACLCYEVSDRDGTRIAEEGIRENADFIGMARDENSDFIKATFGLHASFTLSDRTLQKAREVAEGLGVGFHIHVAEGEEDVLFSLSHSGKRVVERLADFGILGGKTIAAHCIHVDQREIGILKDTGTMVVHNPSSNMNNAVGLAPIKEMLEEGVTVGLGTDGMTSDIFSELRIAFLLQKHASGDPRRGWNEVEKLYFENNPRIFSRFFEHKIGELNPGSYADLIVLEYDPPTPLDDRNFLGHLLFALSAGAVTDTMVGGKFLMKGRRLLFLDEGKIVFKARELARRLWERF